MLFFLWREFNTRAGRLLLFSAAGLMAFAVGLDFIEGLRVNHPLNAAAWLSDALGTSMYTIDHFSKSLRGVPGNVGHILVVGAVPASLD